MGAARRARKAGKKNSTKRSHGASVISSGRFRNSVTLRNREMSCAQFAGTDLSGSDFFGTRLTNANFQGSRLVGVNFTRANLRGADLCSADVTDAVFDDADVRGARFSGAIGLTGTTISQLGRAGAIMFDTATPDRKKLAG
jgi:uncharacterized protein YjbI with pentapeptide repeats